jgi:hypothetical protein
MKPQSPQFIKIAILGFCAVLLTGCSNSLSPEEAKVSIDLGDWSYSLVGDEAVITGVSDISEGNKSEYTLALEAKNVADEWEIEDQKSQLTGSVSKKFSLKLSNEGEQLLRISLRNDEGKFITSSPEVKIVIKDVKAGLTNLYYGQRIACDQGRTKCFEYILAHNYPGFYNLEKSEKQKLIPKYAWTADSTPNLNSILPDSSWLYPVTCEKNLLGLDVSKPLPGRTFTIETSTKPTYTIHFTYLKGEFYYYNGLCL